jgi:hypothetical protein
MEATVSSFFTLKPRGCPLPKRYSTAYTPGARLAALHSTSASAWQATAFSHIVHHHVLGKPTNAVGLDDALAGFSPPSSGQLP